MLIDLIKEKLKDSMFNKDNISKSIFRTLLGEISTVENSSSQNGKQLTEEQICKIINKIINNNNETKSFYKDSEFDKIEILNKENEILSALLPKFLSKDEIINILQESKITINNDGKTIGLAMKEIKSRNLLADGNVVKEAIFILLQ